MTVVTLFATQEMEAASGVGPDRALADAGRLLAQFPDWELYRGDGTSMAPRFDANHLLFVESATSADIRPGMIAVFRDADGDLVAHTVLAADALGIVSTGLNNGRRDPAPIAAESIIGVVVGTLAANAPIPANSGLPVALGKSY